ncbi:hypothetical protein GWN42_09830 [candidate division KSB1 bacterium]|nr:hypothetical protein [candidate division KSB1 bacterium]
MNSDLTNDKKLSFEEFKLFYESTEKVTDRRLLANRWNYSICLVILVAIAGLIKWTLTDDSFFFLGISATLILSVMAFLFCSLWIGQIRDFKSLNNAKFKVLNEMAPKMEFDAANPNLMVSFCPFEKEWQVLQENKAAQEISQINIVALKSSNTEFFIPKAFRILFLLLIAGIITFVLLNWDFLINSLEILRNLATNNGV